MRNEFINKLIDELKDINEDRKNRYEEGNQINIPYVVSVIEQHIENCTEFINDIKHRSYYINYYDDTTNGYTNGYIDIILYKDEDGENYYSSFEDFYYRLTFKYDQRHWGGGIVNVLLIWKIIEKIKDVVGMDVIGMPQRLV